MEIGVIQGHTNIIGKSQGYRGLPIRSILIDCPVNGPDTIAVETAWLPSPEEIGAMRAGAPIILRCLFGQPSVWLYVGEKPEENDRG